MQVGTMLGWMFLLLRPTGSSSPVAARMQQIESDVTVRSLWLEDKIRSDLEGFVGGKYSARGYVDEDGKVTVAWVNSGDAEEVGSHTRSSTSEAGVNLRPAGTSTRVCAAGHVDCGGGGVRALPVILDSGADKARHTHALLHAITKSYDIVDKFLCQRMGSQLVEGDWKSTFGQGDERRSTCNVITTRRFQWVVLSAMTFH
ncbi:hypothetical protein PHYPSEUDO_002209 [Phytophthora pseudosyringae]|uniref:Uncharacterized protein n=1 Tax=Phytophthora pseudosyringae TaxID=221518 RepID=A0A8T1VY19_9STRA|nr:hypothetical protein PHYPSEUDO_002209 [Phytophthora pseudosyringae]